MLTETPYAIVGTGNIGSALPPEQEQTPDRQRQALRLTQLGVSWTGILTLREAATASRQPETAGQRQ